MENESTPIALYAFWEHTSGTGDTYLGAPVAEMRDDGTVKPAAYGGQVVVTPCKLVPEKAGEALNSRILDVDARLKSDIDTLRANARAERAEILGLI